MKRCLILLLALCLTLALAACGGDAGSQSDSASATSSQGDTSSPQNGDPAQSEDATQSEDTTQTGNAAQSKDPAQTGDGSQTGESSQSPAPSGPVGFTALTHKELVEVYDAAYAYYDEAGYSVLLLTEINPRVGEVAFLASFMEDTEPDRTIELSRQDGQWVVVSEG